MSAASVPVSLTIEGMSCGHCVAAVKNALQAVPGITVQHVDIGAATIVVDEASALPDAALAAVREAGYEAKVAGESSGSRPSANPRRLA